MGNESSKPGSSDGQPGPNPSSSEMSPATAADITVTHPSGDGVVDKTRIHVVAAGDTLASIAVHFYGDADGWQRIFDANRDQLTDPERIEAGQMLKIPVRR